MEDLKVRRATLDDAHWVVDLSARVQAALTEAGSLQHIGPHPLDVVERSIQGGNCYLLEARQQRLGSVLLDPIDGTSPLPHTLPLTQWGLDTLSAPLWYLHALMIEPAAQGGGRGLVFLEGVKQWVVPERGTVILDCWAGNHKLHDFYLRAGFTFHDVFPVHDYEVAVFFYSRPLADRQS